MRGGDQPHEHLGWRMTGGSVAALALLRDLRFQHRPATRSFLRTSHYGASHAKIGAPNTDWPTLSQAFY